MNLRGLAYELTRPQRWKRLLVRLACRLGLAEANRPLGSVPATVFAPPDGGSWYAPVMLPAESLGARATSAACARGVLATLERLEPDAYAAYVCAYYREGLARFGDGWLYADILTALHAAAELVRPKSYLEIGVRRGRSLAVVAAVCPECDILGFDLWLPGYAGMPNPGPEFVGSELKKIGHRGRLHLVSGDSHATVPRYLRDNPEAQFDVVTVDGDHSRRGATLDLRQVMPRIKIGGVLVFDDICHPDFRHLRQVWKTRVVSRREFASWEFTALGYGVGLAIRKESG
ncbi:MAG TPA: class I SAM-dependent methyltransferase [Thermoanaerobaculaceae bacterium]|nr:class I SAM-dependent methyltransferase [Thermoanaerobaculaceae bacterium]